MDVMIRNLNNEERLLLGCIILGGGTIILMFSILIILNEIIMKIITIFVTCYLTILVYRIIIGYCFIQMKLNEVRTFSDISNRRFKESRNGNRNSLVIGFSIPTMTECYDLLKIIPRLVPTKI